MKTVCAWKLPSKTALYQWTFMRPKRCGGEKEKTLLDEDATMGLQHIDADNTLDPQHMPGVDKELFDARLKGGYSKQIRWKYQSSNALRTQRRAVELPRSGQIACPDGSPVLGRKQLYTKRNTTCP